jgi:hypothetical protein
MLVQITRSFPPVPQVPSTLCPAVTGFPPALFLCVSQAVFSCAGCSTGTHPFLMLNQEAHTAGVLLTIAHPVEHIVTLTSVPPFPIICPGVIRC